MKDKDKGEGFMHPPYKKPVGPTEKPHYVHGYKNFKSNIKSNHPSKRKVFKDGPKNRMHYDKSASPNKMGEYSPFKMKGFSGFGNSPVKQKGFVRAPEGFDHAGAKAKAKQQLKKHGAKSGHGRMVGGKIVADKVSKTPGLGRIVAKQVAKRAGALGVAATAYDIGKTAKEAIPGLKKRAKSGNVNIGRKI